MSKDLESRCWREIEEIHDRFQDEVRQARQLEMIKIDLVNGGFLEADA